MNNLNNKDVQPTLLLRGVNLKTLMEEFLAGKYDGVTLPQKRKVVGVIKKSLKQDTVSSNTEFNDIYEIKKKEETQRIYTTNIQLFDEYIRKVNKDGTATSTTNVINPMNVKCVYCRRTIQSGKWIPSVIVDYKKDGDTEIYTGYDAADNIRCAKTHLLRESLINPNDLTISGSFIYLNRINNNKPIKELPDWRLLKENGGSMTDEQFFGMEQPLVRLPNLVFLPAKIQYTKSDF